MITPDIENEVSSLIEQGDDLLDEDRFAGAVKVYQQAIALLPAPQYSHVISLSAFLALGEGFFFSGYYDLALSAFSEALKAPGGVENPLVHLRMGQAYFEIGDSRQSADSLTRAYALDGLAIFDGEEQKYLAFLSMHIAMH